MTTTIDGPSDSSVTFSLAELVKLEQDRIHEERAREAHAAKMQAERARHDAERTAIAEAEQRAHEEARRRAISAREAEEIARIEGRKNALAEVARIEAEAKARLDAENATRAHELALLRVRLDHGAVRGRGVLAGLLALSIAGAIGVAIAGRAQASRLEESVASLREKSATLEAQRDEARTQADRSARAEREATQREAAAQKAHEEALAAARAATASEPGAGVKPVRGGPIPKVDPQPKDDRPKCTNPTDPLCGFDGRGI